MLLNTLPKSGTNLLISWLELNGKKNLGSLSPERLYWLNPLIKGTIIKRLIRRNFVDIGIEESAFFPKPLLSRKLLTSSSAIGYVSAHMNYDQRLELLLNKMDLKMIYCTRDHLDVIYSYCMYVDARPRHIYHHAMREIGTAEFVRCLVLGRHHQFKFRPILEQMRRMDSWISCKGVVVFNYTKYCENPEEYEASFLERLAIESGNDFSFKVGNAYGLGPTFNIGGNESWKKSSLFIEVFQELGLT